MNPAGTSHPIWDTRRLWSLADMINFILHNFVVSYDVLKNEVIRSHAEMMAAPHAEVPDRENKRLRPLLNMIGEQCVENLALPEAWNTMQEIYQIVGNYEAQPYTWHKLHSLLELLERQIQRQAQGECFFHYSREDTRAVSQIPKDWASVITAFPSAQKGIEAALDCRALKDQAGCIFHMIGIAEMGLRAIARERGVLKVGKNKPIEFAMWGEIIKKVHEATDRIRMAKITNSTTRASR